MARDDRRDAPHNGVHGAHKSYKERKGATSIHSDPASPPDVPGLLHTTSLGRTGCGALLVSPRGRFILGGAFRLYVLRDKSAVRAGTAFHKGLRLAHKRVRQRIAANVSNRKGLSFPIQHEINAPGKVTDTSLLHGTGDAHALRSRRSAQGLELGNRVVIGFALAVPEPSEKPQGYHDDSDTDAKLCLARVRREQKDRKSTRLNSSHVASSYS